MYNTRIKNLYLKTISSEVNRSFYKGMFTQLAEMEKQLGKDLFQFSTQEVQEFLNTKSFKTRSSFTQFQKMISAYIEWCVGMKIIDASEIDVYHLAQPPLREFDDTMVIRNEQDLIQSIESIYPDEHWHFETPCLLLSWLGLTIDEIVNLRKRRVDLENRCIIRIDKSVAASNWSDLIQFKLDQYVKCEEGTQIGGKGTYKNYRDEKSNRFIVGFYGKNSKKFGTPIPKDSIVHGISKLNRIHTEKGNPPRLTMKNVWNCGRYYALYVAKKNGLQIYSKQNQEHVAKILRTESLATVHSLLGSTVPKYFRVFEAAENEISS